LRYIIRDDFGKILGSVEDDDDYSAGCGCLLIIFVGILLVASILTLPHFILFYLTQIQMTYVVIIGVLLINSLLFITKIPILLINALEIILLTVLLINNNTKDTNSFFGGVGPNDLISYLGMIIVSFISSIIAILILTLMSAGLAEIIKKIKNNL